MFRIGPTGRRAAPMLAGGLLIAAAVALGSTVFRAAPSVTTSVTTPDTADVIPAEQVRAFFANAAPGDTFRECATCPEMAFIPAGAFDMGGKYTDERPLRTVTFARPFTIARTEITFGDWDACVAAGGCGHKPSDQGWGRGARPVINVTPRDAQQYAAWLSRKTGARYRLPTEAEWEYAARAGATGEYAWGEEIGAGNANCIGCGSAWDKRQTAPVRSFKPNAWGLADTSGNVFEWTADCYHDTYDGAPTDGSAWTADCKEGTRVARGGAWSFDITSVRLAYRMNVADGIRGGYIGFRLVRESN